MAAFQLMASFPESREFAKIDGFLVHASFPALAFARLLGMHVSWFC